MAEVAVWFQHRLERMAIDRSLHSHLAARRQFRARLLRQTQDGPPVDRVQVCVKTNWWYLSELTHRSHILRSCDHDLKVRATLRNAVKRTKPQPTAVPIVRRRCERRRTPDRRAREPTRLRAVRHRWRRTRADRAAAPR